MAKILDFPRQLTVYDYPVQWITLKVPKRKLPWPLSMYLEQSGVAGFLTQCRKQRPSFSDMFVIRLCWQSRYPEDADGISKASLDFCRQQSIKWFMATAPRYGRLELGKAQLYGLVEKIVATGSEEAVADLFREGRWNNNWRVSPSQYVVAMMTKARRRSEVIRLLEYCQRSYRFPRSKTGAGSKGRA